MTALGSRGSGAAEVEAEGVDVVEVDVVDVGEDSVESDPQQVSPRTTAAAHRSALTLLSVARSGRVAMIDVGRVRIAHVGPGSHSRRPHRGSGGGHAGDTPFPGSAIEAPAAMVFEEFELVGHVNILPKGCDSHVGQ